MAVASQNSDLHGYGGVIREELAKRLVRDGRAKALDVGTGFGINAAFLAAHLKKGSEVWTVDPSAEVLEKVKSQMGEEAAAIRFAEATADAMPFEGGYFDYVVSVMVLHHLEKLGPALKEMLRVLKSGGRLVVVDYAPVAAKRLEFTSRHPAEDFFTARRVASALKRLGVEASQTEKDVWYLVDARKPSAPRRPRALGLARGARGR